MYNGNPWQAQLESMQLQLEQLKSQPQQSNQFPTLNQIIQPQQPQRTVETVHGIEGARAFALTLPPSSSTIAIDASDDIIFYFILTDANGVSSIVAYDGIRRDEESNYVVPQQEEYVRKTDYEELKKEVKALSDSVQNLLKNSQSKSYSKGDK